VKILFINDYAIPEGGAEILILKLREALRERGHNARLFASNAGEVHHVNITPLTSFVLDHFYGARVFAAARAQNWSLAQRLFYAGGNPFLMPRTLRGWLGHIRAAQLR
jgi:hypothetical protein